MLSIEEIEKEFPLHLQGFKRNMLREYLQYKILDSLFSHVLGQKFRFIGGTALRIIHNLPRFSEDLDFDHTGISFNEFKEVSEHIKNELELEGYIVDIDFSGNTAFRCKIKVPKLLYEMGLSPHQEERILIQLDTEDQSFEFTPDKTFINKFDVFKLILVTPIDILLSKKIYTAFNRKRPKGSDFFDIIFLLGKTRPNQRFLFQKLKLSKGSEIFNHIVTNSREINFEALEKDLSPFIFKAGDEKRISGFLDYIETKGIKSFMSIEEYLPTQGFEYDDKEEMYYHIDNKTIMHKKWVVQNPKKAELEAMLINKKPKVFLNSFTTNDHKGLFKKYKIT